MINTALLYVRAFVYWIGLFLSILVVGMMTPFLLPFPHHICYRFLRPWCNFNVWWVKVTCGIKYNVIGMENVDFAKNGIILGNHQSTWETMFIPAIFPPISWVLKKELFKLPIFGWA